MQCPRCQAEIPAEDVNLDNLVAKCRQCNEVFSFADQVQQTAQLHQSPSRKLPVPKPDRLRIEDLGDPRRIIRRWFSTAIIVLVFFCIFWDGFLIVWYWIAFTKPGPWIMVVFPLLHVAAGVYLTYFALAGLFNHTTVTIECNQLTVRHGPVPWKGVPSLAVEDIIQLYCDQSYSSRNRNSNWQYNVNALMADERKVKLLGSLPKEEALFFEQQLEEWLGIEPYPVTGEVEK